MNDSNFDHKAREEENSKQEGEMTRRELLKKASPLGRLSMVNHACTACGLCSAECAAGALSLVNGENNGSCRLLFRHHLCIACGKCVKICPEKCLQVERTLDPDRLNGPAELLFEDEVVSCSKCGTPFASRALINSLKSKLGITGQSESTYLEICPDCKTGIRLTGAER